MNSVLCTNVYTIPTKKFVYTILRSRVGMYGHWSKDDSGQRSMEFECNYEWL